MASGNSALILFDCEVVCINNGVLKTVIPPDILYDLNSCDFYQGFTVWENEGILQLISGKARLHYLVAWAVLIFACAYFKHIFWVWVLYFWSCYKPHSLGLFSVNEPLLSRCLFWFNCVLGAVRWYRIVSRVKLITDGQDSVPLWLLRSWDGKEAGESPLLRTGQWGKVLK